LSPQQREKKATWKEKRGVWEEERKERGRGAIILVGEVHGADGTVKVEGRRGHIRGLRISSGMSRAKL